MLPALRSQHNGLPCLPSTHSSGHRERLTTKASKSPRTPDKSSGCRHQEPHAHRNSSTAYDHPFAGFRSFVFTPPSFPCIRGLPPRCSRPDPPAFLTSLPACDRLAARRDLHDAPVNAYTWQRGRPTALIHPPDRRRPDTLRRDPPIKVPGRPPRHDPGTGEPDARPLRAWIAARADRGAGKLLDGPAPSGINKLAVRDRPVRGADDADGYSQYIRAAAETRIPPGPPPRSTPPASS